MFDINIMEQNRRKW